MAKTFNTADREVADLNQEELAHEKDRLRQGAMTLNNEIGQYIQSIANARAALDAIANNPNLNALQRMIETARLNRSLASDVFNRDVRVNALRRVQGRYGNVVSSMTRVGNSYYGEIQSARQQGMPTGTDYSAPLISREDEQGTNRPMGRMVGEFFSRGVQYFRNEQPIQKFVGKMVRNGSFSPMGVLGMTKSIPMLGTALSVGESMFQLAEAFAGYQKKMFAEVQQGYNATLLSGLDFTTASGLGHAISVRGGSEQEGLSMSGNIARQLGGLRYGQMPAQLMNAAMRFGLRLTGSGAGGMATTEEILMNVADLMKDANAMDKEKLAYMASQLGLSGAQIRAMEGGAESFAASIHVFDGLVERFGKDALVQMADNAKFASEVRSLAEKNFQMGLFGGSFSEKWDTGIAELLNSFNLAFGDTIEENRKKQYERDQLKMMIGTYNKKDKEGSFKSDADRKDLEALITEGAAITGFGVANAQMMLNNSELQKEAQEKALKESWLYKAVERAKSSKEKLARGNIIEKPSRFVAQGLYGAWIGDDAGGRRSTLFGSERAALKSRMIIDKDENGQQRIIGYEYGNDNGGLVVQGDINVVSNADNVEKLTQDLKGKATEAATEVSERQNQEALRAASGSAKR